MTSRFRAARECARGACNPRPIANALLLAIDECRREDIEPSEDVAVYIISHHLHFILTGEEVVDSERWDEAAHIVGSTP